MYISSPTPVMLTNASRVPLPSSRVNKAMTRSASNSAAGAGAGSAAGASAAGAGAGSAAGAGAGAGAGVSLPAQAASMVKARRHASMIDVAFFISVFLQRYYVSLFLGFVSGAVNEHNGGM